MATNDQAKDIKLHNNFSNSLSFLPLGGAGDVTRNMYVYEYQNQILLVDCGLGFADETMLGVDLLLPDISYLLQSLKQGKKIVGMAISHGHEDHMGGLPFILPQLPDFPIFSTPFSAAMANKKLQEFGISKKVQSAEFGLDKKITFGPFSLSFLYVTHSVPDTSHIFIRTPIGNLYHGSDYKFDNEPFDHQVSDYASIQKAGDEGILALMTDCLGAERQGKTPSENGMQEHFLDVFKTTTGKVIVTTYSSHISRLNQVLWAAEKSRRQVCFVGRSLVHAVEVAKTTGEMTIPKNMEIPIHHVKSTKPGNLVLVVAGSQGQENSALTRVVAGTHKEVRLEKNDTVIYSSDTIPGNEVMVNSVIDEIAKKNIRVLYSGITHDFHVSGHGSQDEMAQLLAMTRPRFVVPISGNYRHMAAYKNFAVKQGLKENQILLLDDGQELVFDKNSVKRGNNYPVRTIYVDEISGEEIEEYVLVDRQKLSTEGIVIVMAQLDNQTGQLLQDPDIIARGFSAADLNTVRKIVRKSVQKALQKGQPKSQKGIFTRKLIRDVVEREITRTLKRKPLIMPVVIEI